MPGAMVGVQAPAFCLVLPLRLRFLETSHCLSAYPYEVYEFSSSPSKKGGSFGSNTFPPMHADSVLFSFCICDLLFCCYFFQVLVTEFEKTMPLPETMFCAEQIKIPPELPDILKQFTKAAIRTQPRDLLQWSAA